MNNLSTDVDNLKKKYREIFLQTSEDFSRRFEEIEPKNLLKFFNEDILKEIFLRQLKMLEYRKNFSCSGCAACCKLACSEFSYDELKQKAQNGDNFASQFINVFVPYKDEDEAKDVYPEYFELLNDKAENEKVHFYHCPKVTTNNRCPDYENRPQICKDFPDNPIGFLPKTCGYNSWKNEVEIEALRIRAMLEIVGFYKSKIQEI